MPFALALVGLLMVIAAARGTEHELAHQLAQDFTGAKSFLVWLACLAIIGGAGYVPPLKRTSDALLFLILLSFVLSNQGIWARIAQAAEAPPAAVAAVPVTGAASGSGSSDASNPFAAAGSLLSSFL